MILMAPLDIILSLIINTQAWQLRFLNLLSVALSIPFQVFPYSIFRVYFPPFLISPQTSSDGEQLKQVYLQFLQDG